MNSNETQHTTAQRAAYCLIAGALAAFVFMFEASVLELLIWAFGGGEDVTTQAVAWVVLRNSAYAVPSVLAAGFLGGLVLGMAHGIMPQRLRRWAIGAMPLLWILGALAYVHAGSSGIVVQFGPAHLLLDVVCIVALSVGAWLFWRRLAGWLKEGKIQHVLIAIAALGAGLWFPLVVCILWSQ